MIEAKRMAQKLISRFQSNDPFRIADSLDYIVIFVPLRGIRGFHQYVQRNHIIYIDNSLDEVQQRWVCAHELGHIFLHPHLSEEFDGCSSAQIAESLQLPPSLVEYAMK